MIDEPADSGADGCVEYRSRYIYDRVARTWEVVENAGPAVMSGRHTLYTFDAEGNIVSKVSDGFSDDMNIVRWTSTFDCPP